MSHPYVILGLAALSFALGQSGPLIMRRPGILRFVPGGCCSKLRCSSASAHQALFAWLLGTAATDFVASFRDLFTIICLGSLPLLFAGISFAPHLGPPFMGIFYVISFFDARRPSQHDVCRPAPPRDSVVRGELAGCAARSGRPGGLRAVERAAGSTRCATSDPTRPPRFWPPCRVQPAALEAPSSDETRHPQLPVHCWLVGYRPPRADRLPRPGRDLLRNRHR